MRAVQHPKVVNFLYRWDWVPIILSAPLFAFSSWLPLIPLIIVPGLWIAIWLAGGKPLVRTPLNLPILMIELMILVSVWATYDIHISLSFLSGSVIGLGVFFMVARYAESPRGWWATFLVLVGLSTLIAVVESLLISWPQKISLLNSISSLAIKPLITLPGLSLPPNVNNLPSLLLCVLPIQIALAGSILFQRKEWEVTFGRLKTDGFTLVLLVSTLVNTLIFLLTQSRGGYISFALTCVFILFAVSTIRSRYIFFGSMLVGLLVLILLWSKGQLSPLLATFNNNPSNATDLSVFSMDQRFEIWSRAIYGIQDFPFTGMGINTFGSVVPVLYPLFSSTADVNTNAHNTYLQIALDLGIPGLIAFLAIQIGTFRMWFKVWKTVKPGQTFPSNEPSIPLFNRFRFLSRAIVLGLGGAFLSQVLIGLTEANALGTYLPIWVLTGLTTCLYSQSQLNKNLKKNMNIQGALLNN